jgi:hypothetical protein
MLLRLKGILKGSNGKDKSKSISMGINVSSVLETINNIKKQSKQLSRENKINIK